MTSHRVTANLFICRCLSVKCAAAVNLLRVRGDDKLAEIYRQRIQIRGPKLRHPLIITQTSHVTLPEHIMDAGRPTRRANALLLKIFIKERPQSLCTPSSAETRGDQEKV